MWTTQEKKGSNHAFPKIGYKHTKDKSFFFLSDKVYYVLEPLRDSKNIK